MNKKGQNLFGEEGMKWFILIISLIIIVVGMGYIFYDSLKPIIDNLPVIGVKNTSGVKNEIGLFRYNFVEAGKEGSKSVVQYYDGVKWNNFTEKKVKGNIFSYTLTLDSFKNYFISLCSKEAPRTVSYEVYSFKHEIGNLNGEKLDITSCGVSSYTKKISSGIDELFGAYIEVNYGKYLITGIGNVYSKYLYFYSPNNAMRNTNEGVYFIIPGAGKGTLTQEFLSSSKEIQDALVLINEREFSQVDNNNRIYFNQKSFSSKEGIDVEVFLQCALIVVPSTPGKDSSGGNLQFSCELYYGNSVGVPISLLKIYIITDSNKKVKGGSISYITSDGKYSIVSNKADSDYIKQKVFDFIDKRRLDNTIEFPFKKVDNLNGETEFYNLCVQRRGTDWIIDVNKPIKEGEKCS